MADLSSSLPVRFGANVTASGTLTMTSTSNALALDSDGMTTVTVDLSNTGTAAGAGAAFSFEATIDDTNWFAIQAYLISSGATPASTMQRTAIPGATGLLLTSLPCRVLLPGIGSYSQVRIRVFVAGTGTTGTIVLSGATADGTVSLASTYQEDDPHTSADLGQFILSVRRDAGTALAGTGNDYIPITTDKDGKLWTSGGQIDNDGTNPFTLGASAVAVMGAFSVAVGANPGTTVTATRAGAPAMSPNRNLYIAIRDGADNGRAANVDASNNLQVTLSGSGGVGSGALNLGKLEDSASGSGDLGVMVLGVRATGTPSDLSAGATNGDYEPFQVDEQGSVFANVAINSRTDTRRKIIIKTKVALAANTATTTDLDNTVTSGKTFVLKGFMASASGKIKLDFQSGSTSQIVGFNSTANPNIFVEFAQPIEFASTVVMHPIVTNLEQSAMDVYITYWGVEV